MYIFFEIDAINIERYYLCHDSVKGIKDKLFVLESKEELNIFRSKNDIYNSTTLKKLELEDLPVGRNNVLVINGNRIPDIYISLKMRRKGWSITYLQHGLYIPFMKRNLEFLLKNIAKSYRYLYYCLNKDVRREDLALNLVRTHLFGLPRSYQFTKNFMPDIALVFSEYWVDWHKKHYFGENPKYLLFRNRDASFSTIAVGDAFIYVYQTLYEDGRVDLKVMMKMLENLINIRTNTGKAMVIKGHPRMSQEMKDLFVQADMPIYFDKVPLGRYAIGHYSSLLGFYAWKGSLLILVGIEGHEIPESISRLGSIICDLNEFDHNYVDVLGSQKDVYQIAQLADYYFNYSTSGKLSI